MDNKIEEIRNLQNNISNAIAIRESKEGKTVLDHIAINALEGTFQRLQKVGDILSVSKYDFVFIGQVGAGKTTAICHLFNLTEES